MVTNFTFLHQTAWADKLLLYNLFSFALTTNWCINNDKTKFFFNALKYLIYLFQLKYTKNQAGLFSTTFEIGGVLGSFGIGFIMDRWLITIYLLYDC